MKLLLLLFKFLDEGAAEYDKRVHVHSTSTYELFFCFITFDVRLRFDPRSKQEVLFKYLSL